MLHLDREEFNSGGEATVAAKVGGEASMAPAYGSIRPSVRVTDVSHAFATSTGGTMLALRGVSLEVAEGDFFGIVGPSGCGKTTFLRLVAGLLEPTNGTITVDGSDPRSSRRERRLAMVFQTPVLLEWRTVLQNVALPGELFGDEEVEERANECLRLVGLEGVADWLPRELSGGMQARVAIARALSVMPRILLMDEPFGHLDSLTREALEVQVRELAQQRGITVLFVTHSLEEAAFLADAVAVMSGCPGGVKRLLEIRYDQPRNWRLRNSLEYTNTLAKLRKAVVADA